MNNFAPLEDPQSVVSLLSEISIFGGLTDQQRQDVLRRVETGSFKRGASIFQAGDEPAYICAPTRTARGLYGKQRESFCQPRTSGRIGNEFVLPRSDHVRSSVTVASRG